MAATEVVKRDVFLPLEPLFGIPVCLTMTDHIDEQGDIPDFKFLISIFYDRNIRRVDRFHADCVISAIHMVDLAGHASRKIR